MSWRIRHKEKKVLFEVFSNGRKAHKEPQELMWNNNIDSWESVISRLKHLADLEKRYRRTNVEIKVVNVVDFEWVFDKMPIIKSLKGV